jgi:hypothetical protein
MRDLLRLSVKQLSARNGDVFKQHCSVTESKGMDKKPAAGICHNYNSGGYKKPVKPEAEKEKESSAALAAPIASISVVESCAVTKISMAFRYRNYLILEKAIWIRSQGSEMSPSMCNSMKAVSFMSF